MEDKYIKIKNQIFKVKEIGEKNCSNCNFNNQLCDRILIFKDNDWITQTYKCMLLKSNIKKTDKRDLLKIKMKNLKVKKVTIMCKVLLKDELIEKLTTNYKIHP